MSAPVQADQAVDIFYSYAHQDESLRAELEKQLSILKRRNIIRTWHDRKITAGSEWAEQISHHLNTANLILLLVSADFLASDYCYDVELTRAMQRHESGEARVVPIILRDVDWQDAAFGALQALPTGARAVTSWPNRDEAFADIARGIRNMISQSGMGADRQSNESESKSESEANVPRLLPYLCNRSEQEQELSAALREHQRVKPRRPFLCIIHGDEFECHQEFLERMQHTAIPRGLNLEAKQLTPEEAQLQWPANHLTSDNYLQAFERNLSGALLQHTAGADGEIIKYLAGSEKPLLLVSHLLTEAFVEADTDLFSAYLKFWEQWPDLPPGRALISCVCLKHQRYEQMGFVQKFRMKRLDARLQAFVSGLDFSASQKLSGVVLSELRAIRRNDAEAWTRIKAVRAFCQIQEKDIRALYQQSELVSSDGLIPMETLADQLRELASQRRRQRGDQ